MKLKKFSNVLKSLIRVPKNALFRNDEKFVEIVFKIFKGNTFFFLYIFFHDFFEVIWKKIKNQYRISETIP